MYICILIYTYVYVYLIYLGKTSLHTGCNERNVPMEMKELYKVSFRIEIGGRASQQCWRNGTTTRFQEDVEKTAQSHNCMLKSRLVLLQLSTTGSRWTETGWIADQRPIGGSSKEPLSAHRELSFATIHFVATRSIRRSDPERLERFPDSHCLPWRTVSSPNVVTIPCLAGRNAHVRGPSTMP